jgi:hypothetical protein
MKLLSQISIQRPGGEARIQLFQGDLTAIPKEYAVDILAISAFPGSYIPVENTLIGALHDKGINVADMAKDKEIDLLTQLSCWLSKPLSEPEQERFNFKRILCFEPKLQSQAPETVVGNIFRSVNMFVFNDSHNTIGMPVLASGNQKVPMEKMLSALIDASIFWLQSGLPLNCIRLVVRNDEQAAVALPVFNWAKQQTEIKNAVQEGKVKAVDALKFLEKNRSTAGTEQTLKIVETEIKEAAEKQTTSHQTTRGIESPLPQAPSPAAAPSDGGFDFFISYAHKHSPLINSFVDELKAKKSGINIFYDRDSIPPGGLWLKQISDAIMKAKKVLIFLSPDYSNSAVCWDEFQCAKLIEYNNKKQIIQTVYLYNDAELSPIMGIHSWLDCREGDSQKLKDVINKLIT